MKVIKLLINSINFESLIITIFVLVDDWYQIEGQSLKGLSRGAQPYAKRYPLGEMIAREIFTLALVMDYLPFPAKTQFIGFIRANYGQWFAQLLGQIQFNRR